jgi:hypothetical protein
LKEKTVKKFNSLSEFYPYYLNEHRNQTCRIFHFIGTSGFIVNLVLAIILAKPLLLLLGLTIGYGSAWIGHFMFERNKPATFSYPFYSLVSDFIMFFHMITFQLKKQFRKHGIQEF